MITAGRNAGGFYVGVFFAMEVVAGRVRAKVETDEVRVDIDQMVG